MRLGSRRRLVTSVECQEGTETEKISRHGKGCIAVVRQHVFGLRLVMGMERGKEDDRVRLGFLMRPVHGYLQD